MYRQVTNKNRKRQRVRRPRSRKNSPRVVVPKPKGPRYAKTSVIALPDTTINKYKGSIYIEKIGSNGQVRYSPEVTPRR
ncbi:8046_t:CDS:2 [Dentiscutata erythropus]|uniref:8046_t:CDS:1 n=1 Tax=Dentiscutata erythropus TaxID=1348616 RepID=A0A9N9CQL0_9GLOM|nr:8046_t:CDS:2 [Dentiscutata erythropus]